MSGSAVTLADITSASWSLTLDSTAGGGAGSGIGKVVQAYDDIDQCVSIILTTLPGEDPWRPTFGCDLLKYIDKPITISQPAIVAAVFQALEQWEPRISVLSVSARAGGSSAPGTIAVSVQWQIDQGAVAAPSGARGPQPQTTTVIVQAH